MRFNRWKLWTAAGILVGCMSSSALSTVEREPKAIQLFNGKDLKDWRIKIRLHEYGENYANTFRVEDGLLKVRYDGYSDFNQQYGHIGYKTPFSYYLLKVEYRFVGEQANGGEGWAWRNSGAMLHGQEPSTMLKDQDFPISIEGQMLGGDGVKPRTTSNLCTPGTNVVLKNELYTPHCLSSNSKTYDGDQWVTAEFLVLGDSIVQHILDKHIVLQYEKPQIGGVNVENYDPKEKTDGKRLEQGYIYLQSESHPIDFRKVELYDLSPYKKKKQELNRVIEKLLSKG
ncbi:3-keto-disaccharide hydrolase [Sphingobacterium sp. MYb382]|uniref:3-keto-disaccharide hydrolase n=1 Tax=Sphingobacterium sp. MYb382 TaxID=2745278 RepID=UPI0030A7785D